MNRLESVTRLFTFNSIKSFKKTLKVGFLWMKSGIFVIYLVVLKVNNLVTLSYLCLWSLASRDLLIQRQHQKTLHKVAKEFEMEKIINLGIPHVGENIFENIGTDELCQYFLVSQTWKALAENVLLKRWKSKFVMACSLGKTKIGRQ